MFTVQDLKYITIYLFDHGNTVGIWDNASEVKLINNICFLTFRDCPGCAK